MMIGISGTPGTGKSAVSGELARRGHHVLHLSETVEEFIIEKDRERDTLIVDEEAWVTAFTPVEGFLEGHLAHLLPCDRVVILRCRPDVIRSRLAERGYPEEKIRENTEAEALDVILIEALEIHPPGHIYELDTTSREVSECAGIIEQFIRGETPPSYGTTDWSDYLEVR